MVVERVFEGLWGLSRASRLKPPIFGLAGTQPMFGGRSTWRLVVATLTAMREAQTSQMCEMRQGVGRDGGNRLTREAKRILLRNRGLVANHERTTEYQYEAGAIASG